MELLLVLLLVELVLVVPMLILVFGVTVVTNSVVSLCFFLHPSPLTAIHHHSTHHHSLYLFTPGAMSKGAQIMRSALDALLNPADLSFAPVTPSELMVALHTVGVTAEGKRYGLLVGVSVLTLYIRLIVR